MKEKRYYCDFAWKECGKKEEKRIYKLLTVSFIIIIAISSIFYYNLFMYNYGDQYGEYKYLYEIAGNIIGKHGINISAIPEDVVEYEIKYKDEEIVFKYRLNNNKEKIFSSSLEMTIKLSKDFEILNKEPNYSSKEEYLQSYKKDLYINAFVAGAFTSCIFFGVVFLLMCISVPISMMHKKIDMQRKFS